VSNARQQLSDLEEAWLVRALYREDRLNQPQIAQLVGRHKSWVCRRLVLAEGLTSNVEPVVRLGFYRRPQRGRSAGCRAATRRKSPR
jgi:hypothetical protein